jgi:hypothetical protein
MYLSSPSPIFLFFFFPPLLSLSLLYRYTLILPLPYVLDHYYTSAFELVSGDKLSLLRSADLEEIGIHFDNSNQTAKHFFLLHKPISKFCLKFAVCICL